MPFEPEKQERESIGDIETRRLELGISQFEWASRLGITQGHYSKIVSGKAAPGKALLDRIGRMDGAKISEGFEQDLLAACRSAPRLRKVIALLLDMHGYAFDGPSTARPPRKRAKVG